MLTNDEEEYLATLSNTKVVHILPYDSKLKRIAEELITKVHEVDSTLEARFSGAAALGISGQNDIDLDFMCIPKDFQHYLKTFTTLFGFPRDTSTSSAVWTFYIEGIEIDMWLSDPASESSKRQWKVFQILQNNLALCKEYEKLKQNFNNKGYKDYQRAKYEFYNRILAEAKVNN